MNVDETRILIGGRKLRKIPPHSKLFVEHEDTVQQGMVRQRRPFVTSTPANTYQQFVPLSDTSPPPAYSSTSYWTPSNKTDERGHQLYDSGYYDNTLSQYKTYSHQLSPGFDTSQNRSFREKIYSTIGKLKSRYTGKSHGRLSFIENESKVGWEVLPQYILGCLMFITVFSSLGFAVLISIKKFENGKEELLTPMNGKYNSIQFANEKSLIKDRFAHESNIPSENDERERYLKDPLLDAVSDIGQMSDILLADKVKSDDLGFKLKTSRINLESEVETENSKSAGESIGRELLTHHPLAIEVAQDSTAAPVKEKCDVNEVIELIDNNHMLESGKVTKSTEILEKEEKSSYVTKYVPYGEEVVQEPIGTSDEIRSESSTTKHKPTEIVNTHFPDLKNVNKNNGDVRGGNEVSESESLNQNDSRDVYIRNQKRTMNSNPLLISINNKKMSKARKIVQKIAAPINLPGESVDYPDLPTFRGSNPPVENDVYLDGSVV